MEFVREPRQAAPPMPRGEVVLQAPPAIPKLVPANPLTRLLPAAMLVAALGMMAVYFTSGATRSPMFMFFPVMMLTSVVGSLVYGARGANRTAEVNHDRQRYLRYLDDLDSEIALATADQQRSMRWSHPEPASLWTLVGSRRMWERGPDDADFCLVRVGLGDRALCTPLVAPEFGVDEEVDPITVSAVRGLVDRRSRVADLPITVALRGFRLVTVDGERNATLALLRSMICQLAVLHGPDCLAITAVVTPKTESEWDWLKWLPHYRPAPGGPDTRHTVVLVDGGTAPADVLDNASVTVVELDGTSGGALALRVDDDRVTATSSLETSCAQPDSLSRVEATGCARRLARHRVADASKAGPPSAATGWLGLMGIDDVRRLDPEGRWAGSTSGRIRAVPIGVAATGTRVELDINEAARGGMGPHGLCVGATGSGKSELLRTLALGMVTMNSPDALNLILVDFKGGATFLGLERMRHVAAVITNLADEAHHVSRMNDAITGEITRRQELLRSAGNYANVSEYEHARQRGAALPPLPALFILVDEFSELLSQHPEFAELFVTIGRLGRSLGMHLLLASQRLDESRLRGLETHLSYRICLKTFSAAESRAVLGVPDAHHLPGTPGAAYLKPVSGDLVRFQTAFVSGPAVCPAKPPPAAPVPPRLFTARPERTPKPAAADTAQTEGAPTATLLSAMVDRLAGHGTPAHRVWLPPLSQPPTLDGLPAAGGLTVPIGLVDNPFHQRRDVLVADLGGAAGNVAVVGAPRSGKSTALRTLLLALAQRHDPSEIGFYCLDFGGGTLSSVKRLPHVGVVAGRSEADLCRRTIALMESVISAREARFRRLGIDSVADYRRMRSAGDAAVTDDPYGDVFLVVDGWATLRREFEDLEASITAIAARGLSFGLHVVVSASRWAELRPALKDQIGTRIELRLGDPVESEMDRRRAQLLSDRPPGRGITRDGREMVVALPRTDGEATPHGLAEAVAATVDRIAERCDGICAPPVRLLPRRVEHGDLAASVTGRQPLLGVGEHDLAGVTADFGEHQHLLIIGEPDCGKTAALRLLCRELIRTNAPAEARLEIVDFRRTLLGVVESDHLGGYTASPAGLASRLRTLLDQLQTRMPDERVTQQQLRTRSWWSGPDIYLIVDDYDLAAGVTGNPMATLADFLPHARDLGLHVIVARRSGGAARAMFDPVLSRLREVGCMGLVMSASPEEGVLLGSVRPAPLPPGRGTLITRGGADQLIQVAWTDPP